MRKYEDQQVNKLSEVVCNKCGKKIKIKNGYLKEGCFSSDFCFGYFSGKDGFRYKFDLCEDCYDEFITSMEVPVEISEESELL